MMRGRISTIVLIIAATAIWSVVGYRIFRWISPKKDVVPVITTPHAQVEVNGYDTLMLNYRDPFLDDNNSFDVVDGSFDSVAADESSMPVLEYKGLIRGGDGIVKAMIIHDGHLDGFSKGAVIDGLHLTEVAADYIIVQWKGTEYLINAK